MDWKICCIAAMHRQLIFQFGNLLQLVKKSRLAARCRVSQLEVAIRNLKFDTFADITTPEFVELRHANLCVGSVNLAQRRADFTHGSVGTDGIDNVGHGVGLRNISVCAGYGSSACGLL
jgi:hypothetical protein